MGSPNTSPILTSCVEWTSLGRDFVPVKYVRVTRKRFVLTYRKEYYFVYCSLKPSREEESVSVLLFISVVVPRRRFLFRSSKPSFFLFCVNTQ